MTTTDVVDSAIDLPWRNFEARSFGQSHRRKQLLEIHIFPYNTPWDRWKEDPMPKVKTQLDLIRPVVSTQHRHVTDGLQTDTYATTAYTALPIL